MMKSRAGYLFVRRGSAEKLGPVTGPPEPLSAWLIGLLVPSKLRDKTPTDAAGCSRAGEVRRSAWHPRPFNAARGIRARAGPTESRSSSPSYHPAVAVVVSLL